MRTVDGLHLSFHEANLTDYSGMTLKVDKEKLLMQTELVGSGRFGYKVKRRLPFKTPWRTIQISEDAAGLIESKLIVNLNEPNKLGNVTWFKPMKYVGIWWEMHLGKSSWDMASGKHGATTENAKEFINFAAENNIGGLLIEGWNKGWEHWIGFEDREGVFDFITPYHDYDLYEVVRYAKQKGVKIIMHHETSAAPRSYEQNLDTAYSLMNRLDIHSVKTGYVGKIIPKGEYHHGQWMVNHYRNVLETAAKYKVAINAHEPIKATGLRRTYPNAISREGLRGQEFNAWASDGGNPPEHLPIVAFTRMLAGPVDFTPGVFNIKLKPYKENNQINTTLAHQLALYIVIYSPIQMACDLIENYKNQPAFQFIRDVGINWEQTKVLNGEVGEYVTIAREERDTGNWFVGSISDEQKRSITIDFSFLDENKTYKAVIYRDGKEAHWNNNPTDIKIEETLINKTTIKTLTLTAEKGTTGLEIAFEKMPDLIISDVMMPEMDGFEFLRHIKQDNRTSHIPVILLTARAGEKSKIEGLESGADAYVNKPFNITELNIRAKNLIEQRKQLREKFEKNITIEPSEITVTSIDESFLIKAANIVEQHMSDYNFNVVQLSDEMAISRIHLHRKLKALTNQSATQFIRTIRLKRAAQLIKKRSFTISEIAYKVGFTNTSYFHRCFKQTFGVVPTEYEGKM